MKCCQKLLNCKHVGSFKACRLVHLVRTKEKLYSVSLFCWIFDLVPFHTGFFWNEPRAVKHEFMTGNSFTVEKFGDVILHQLCYKDTHWEIKIGDWQSVMQKKKWKMKPSNSKTSFTMILWKVSTCCSQETNTTHIDSFHSSLSTSNQAGKCTSVHLDWTKQVSCGCSLQ